MDTKQLTKISKFLSKYLRHQPEKLGITLDKEGWVEVETLLAACEKQGFPLSLDTLKTVVKANNKQRFAFNETQSKIRANQGHSIEIDLNLSPQTPPDILYHGTAIQNKASILSQGLQKMKRHHVHLAKDPETAIKVGQRYGKPLLFAIDTQAMQQAGHIFYCSENGVWLVESVPAQFLSIIDTKKS